MPGPPPEPPELPSSLEAREQARRRPRPPIAALLALAALGVDPRTACDFRASDGRRCMLDYGHKGDHGL